uniref:Uncharacterized protein n=1 Tax=Anguilla anguilla TaxID=7936 RepID=A0A0E9TLG6_ANGAN
MLYSWDSVLWIKSLTLIPPYIVLNHYGQTVQFLLNLTTEHSIKKARSSSW